MFVTVDGEDIARKIFKRAQNILKSGSRERKVKEIIKT
jgi:hypothetical protein